MPVPRRLSAPAVSAATLLLVCACHGSALTSQHAGSPALTSAPTPAVQTAPVPPPASSPAPTASSAAATGARELPGPREVVAGGVDFADPLSVARAYIAARWTYPADEPARYAAALSAPGLTTPSFHSRSVPSAEAVQQVQVSRDACTVAVASAQYAPEAGNTATTKYVVLGFTTRETYTGAGSGLAAQHDWSLRLLQTAAPGAHTHWLVDAVVVGDD